MGITFCFAQVFHPAFRHAGPTRRELGVPTVFNVLGPLTNPAQPAAAAVGVADVRMAPILAGVLAERGTSALVFVGEDGLDELSTAAPSQVWQVAAGQVTRERLDAVDLGLARAELSDLTGGDPAYNAAVVRAVLDGEKGPVRDAVLLNAAAAVVAADAVESGAAAPLTARMAAALEVAADAVDSGQAADVLRRWVAASAC